MPFYVTKDDLPGDAIDFWWSKRPIKPDKDGIFSIDNNPDSEWIGTMTEKKIGKIDKGSCRKLSVKVIRK